MNPGDVLMLLITDPLAGPNAGFTTTVTDLTTHQTGFMIASSSNGFMNTNYKACAGYPFTFHAAIRQDEKAELATRGTRG